MRVTRLLQPAKILIASDKLLKLLLESERKVKDVNTVIFGDIGPIKLLLDTLTAVSDLQANKLLGKLPMKKLLPRSSIWRWTSLEKSSLEMLPCR